MEARDVVKGLYDTHVHPGPELYPRVAMIVTTNLKFADWVQVFGDERLTAALLDRLTHHAHILELVGESYRFRQRLQETQA